MPTLPLIVAHRGASQEAPENTLAAFNLAFEHGADWIECDVRLTADGHVVCLHDASTARTVRGSRNLVVSKATLEELRHLDMAVPIPTLAEVLGVLPLSGGLAIELKGGPAVSRPAAHIVLASRVEPARVALIAFDPETLREAKRAAPKHPAWLVAGFCEPAQHVEELIATAQRIGADGLDVEGDPAIVDEAFITAVHGAGLSLHVWTVDDPVVARYFHALGVNSITTNRPKELRAALTRPGSEK
jgi:glycerophosphoryl diester phosphodiesterase